ncbi:hypothetical protein [Aeromonas enteropelogenes]|uniref:hypothetical protein n=1 Tax=Aeromonas enteropelogenes TaxID=29489 RepID=UPI003BA30ED3
MQLTPPNPMPMQALGQQTAPVLAKARTQTLPTPQQLKRHAMQPVMQPELAPRR